MGWSYKALFGDEPGRYTALIKESHLVLCRSLHRHQVRLRAHCESHRLKRCGEP